MRRRDFLKRAGTLAAISLGGLGAVRGVTLAAPGVRGARRGRFPHPTASEIEAAAVCNEGTVTCEGGKDGACGPGWVTCNTGTYC